MSLCHGYDYKGIGSELRVSVDLGFVELGDIFFIKLYDKNLLPVLSEFVELKQDRRFTFTYEIPEDEINGLSVGEYTVSVYVERNAYEYSQTLSSTYIIYALPEINVLSYSPKVIQKPIRSVGTTSIPKNDEIIVDYEILGDEIRAVNNGKRLSIHGCR